MVSLAKLFLAILAIAFAFAMSSREADSPNPRVYVEKPIEHKSKRVRGPW